MKARVRIGAVFGVIAAMLLLGAARPASAQTVAIVQGSFYTPNLKANLQAAGLNVTEISSYTAASLSSFNAVIHYGNSFTDMTALNTYVSGGGRLIETPWFWLNNTPPSSLQVFTNGGSAQYSITNPGVTVLDPSSSLLNGVSFPAAGGFNIGRTGGNTFAAGANAVANWNDGTAFIGTRSLGAGQIIGINMHVITSDTAYQVIDQPWATRLFVNAAGPGTTAVVPEPASMAMALPGLLPMGLMLVRRRKRTA